MFRLLRFWYTHTPRTGIRIESTHTYAHIYRCRYWKIFSVKKCRIYKWTGRKFNCTEQKRNYYLSTQIYLSLKLIFLARTSKRKSPNSFKQSCISNSSILCISLLNARTSNSHLNLSLSNFPIVTCFWATICTISKRIMLKLNTQAEET